MPDEELADFWREPVARQLTTTRQDIDRVAEALEDLSERIHFIAGTVTAATLNADMLLDANGPDARMLGDAVRDSLKRLREATEGIRDVVRNGRFGTAAPVAPAALVEQLVADARARFPAVTWSLVVESNVPPRCRVHRGDAGLSGLLNELFDNACEGREEKRPTHVEVRLGFEPMRLQLSLEVRDDGPGFPPELLARGPEPFLGARPGHAGLGLFEVRCLARLTGGGLTLAASPSGGAFARVRLGVAPPDTGWGKVAE